MSKSGLTFIYLYGNILAIECMNLIQIYRCLCDETRLRILHLLQQEPLCVCHFQDILQLPQVAVSKHLAYLRRTGMVEARRHEQWMIYSLPTSPGRELDLQLRCLQDCVQTEPAFSADLRRLKALGPKCNWISHALKAPPVAKRAINPRRPSAQCAP